MQHRASHISCCLSLTCSVCPCSMGRLGGGSQGTGHVPASSLGSNNSMESAKTAAAQREPQPHSDCSEQAKEAAAIVEWIHEQVWPAAWGLLCCQHAYPRCGSSSSLI